MIRVRIRRNGAGQITEFEVYGHAGAGPYGQDIVCAGVSAVVFTALLGLRQVAGIPHQVVEREEEGYLRCRLEGGSPPAWERAQVILETMLAGLRDIEKDYGKHIRVTEGGAEP
ncbi:MAG: ribosomal-processing cysteine protease Prp [Bacillota bacterium]|nr:MAG: ribosomal-processing cysteine protease Prp [Bacillota bacterium]